MLFTHSLTALYSFTYYLQYTSALTKKEIFQHVTAESFSSKTKKKPVIWQLVKPGDYSECLTVQLCATRCSNYSTPTVHTKPTTEYGMVWYGMVNLNL